MAHRLLRDAQADGWERSDFPIICESCLGDNPYVRMLRAEYDKECKICARPFTVLRWRPGRDARYKKTEICQTCCKLKNVCQVCLLDLEYGLPVQVRDTALSINSNDAIPRSDVNREYFAEEHDRRARAGIDYDSSNGKARPNDTILKLQRTAPYYKRNRAHVCSFYVRGECTRGAECPYRHEMPETGELSQQNIKDRYYGGSLGRVKGASWADRGSGGRLGWWKKRGRLLESLTATVRSCFERRSQGAITWTESWHDGGDKGADAATGGGCCLWERRLEVRASATWCSLRK